MKGVVPKDTRYVPLTQQRSCCVPTAISMVMYKLGIRLIPQELLGYHLGLILDKKRKNLFWNMRTGKRPPAGYGTRTYEKRYEINAALKRLKIPLRVEDHRLGGFKTKKDLVDFLDAGIRRNKDFIVILNSDVLNKTRNHNGHACVIDRIYPKRDSIRLIDPLPFQPKWRELRMKTFIEAIKRHPARNGGIMELRKVRA